MDQRTSKDATLNGFRSWALQDIEEAAAHVAAFALLRGIIKRRLVLPEVYDVMGKVEDLMIRSQVSTLLRARPPPPLPPPADL